MINQKVLPDKVYDPMVNGLSYYYEFICNKKTMLRLKYDEISTKFVAEMDEGYVFDYFNRRYEIVYLGSASFSDKREHTTTIVLNELNEKATGNPYIWQD